MFHVIAAVSRVGPVVRAPLLRTAARSLLPIQRQLFSTSPAICVMRVPTSLITSINTVSSSCSTVMTSTMTSSPRISGSARVCSLPLSLATRGLKTVKRATKRRYRDPPKYKMKRKKGAAARFKLVGDGSVVKYWRAGRRHNSQAKSRKRHRLLRRPAYATGPRRRKIIRMLLGYN